MAKLVIIGVIVICIVALIVYITVLICNRELESSWQVIKYTGSSVEPKCIYVCKKCNNQRDINYHYCNNCGARMYNGVERIYYTNGINLDVDE